MPYNLQTMTIDIDLDLTSILLAKVFKRTSCRINNLPIKHLVISTRCQPNNLEFVLSVIEAHLMFFMRQPTTNTVSG